MIVSSGLTMKKVAMVCFRCIHRMILIFSSRISVKRILKRFNSVFFIGFVLVDLYDGLKFIIRTRTVEI